MTPDKLFNCMTEYAAPDWSRFDALELGGCVDDASEDEKAKGETFTIGGVDRDQAEFFTVYGHYKPGHGEGVEAITDCNRFSDAEEVAAELSRLSGLPVNVMC